MRGLTLHQPTATCTVRGRNPAHHPTRSLLNPLRSAAEMASDCALLVWRTTFDPKSSDSDNRTRHFIANTAVENILNIFKLIASSRASLATIPPGRYHNLCEHL